MSYVFFALLAALAFACSGLINKFSSKHAIDNKDSLMLFFMLGAPIFALILLPFAGISPPSLTALRPLIIAELAYLLGFYMFYSGIFTVDASVFAPMFHIQSLFIGILAYLFLNEVFPASNYLWGGIMLFGAFLVSLEEKFSPKSFIKPGIMLILGMQLFHAISNIFLGLTLEHITPVQLLFWANIIITSLIVPFYFLRKPKVKYPSKKIAPMILVGIVGNLGSLAMLNAFAQNVTLSHVISMQSTPIIFLVTIILSKLSPKTLETHTKKVYTIRAIGLILTVLAAIKIATT